MIASQRQSKEKRSVKRRPSHAERSRGPEAPQAPVSQDCASAEAILGLQQTAGNQAVAQRLSQETGSNDLPEGFSKRIQVLQGSGQYLAPHLREEMESSLGANFSGVRLHTGEEADRLSQQISAKAFTVGSDIYFRQGAFNPHTPDGLKTLKHELTHVVQQGGRSAPNLRLGPVDDMHEREAEHKSQERGTVPAKPSTAAAGSVQRLIYPWQRAKMKKLGGSFNAVYRVKHKHSGVGYFKPDTKADPTMGARAVLSATMDQTLGLDALARDKFKTYGTTSGSESGEVTGNSLTDNVFGERVTKKEYDANKKSEVTRSQYKKVKHGPFWKRKNEYFKITGQKINTHDYQHPETQRSLSNLQVEDAILGQEDRHGGNIKIDPTTHIAKGIDNDRMSLMYDNLNEPVKNLRMKKPGETLSPEAQAKRRAARIKQIDRLNFRDRNQKMVGLPSHIDVAAANRIHGMKSSAFMQQMEQNDPENWKRLSDPQKAELRNRYSAMRRYVKAGRAAAGLETDTVKAAKYGSKDYQDMVKAGSGGVIPKIVSNWNQQTFDEQMGQKTQYKMERANYVQRGVRTFNEALQQPGFMRVDDPSHAPMRDPAVLNAPTTPVPTNTAATPPTPAQNLPAVLPQNIPQNHQPPVPMNPQQPPNHPPANVAPPVSTPTPPPTTVQPPQNNPVVQPPVQNKSLPNVRLMAKQYEELVKNKK